MKYKWFFDESGVLTECEPKLDNDTKLEFAPETDEMFYRAKLSGALTFQNEFDAILAKNFGYTHIVVLKRYFDTENDYVEVWRGKFTLTDCTINYDRKTIEVTPATIDRYTDVMAALEKEYNLTTLGADIQPVNILIRPCLQIYSLNDSKVTNSIGKNTWESSCDAVGIADIDNLHFQLNAENFAIQIKYKSDFGSAWAGQTVLYTGTPDYSQTPRAFEIKGKYRNPFPPHEDIEHTLRCVIVQYPDETRFQVHMPEGGGWEGTPFVTATYARDEAGTDADIWIREPGHTPPDDYAADAYAQWTKVYTRHLVQTDLNDVTIAGTTYTLYERTSTDSIATANYNKILEPAFVQILIWGGEQTAPTNWGLNYNDKYFTKPADTLTRHYSPTGQSLWKYVSVWWYVANETAIKSVNNQLTAQRQLRDCFKLTQTILRLMNKAGVHPASIVSGCLVGTNNYVGARTYLIITPRSNVISSYYDTPAQNAPISLAKIFRMLKAVYRCYWFISSDGKLHIEHISYFDNGYSYTELPQTLVDLESDLHTRTRHSKAYGQNVVKFDKSGMAEQFSFGWADNVTRPFSGYPINCTDEYVQKGEISEQSAPDFDSDVDFVLTSPNDVSKDGFFLFALPPVIGGYSNTLKLESVQITDENGDTFDVTLQNADAAFVKIHKTWWRYHMPCENLQINNVADTALTTGRFKTQSLEFSDLAMADVISNVDNCIKLIKTQQGFGAIAKLSINLNSLATTADLVFTLFGRKYYLKGAALNGPMTITLNGEQITITVSNNRFVYGYTEPINELKFAGTDVVSVDFADTDTLAELTSADDMFKNCAELIAVNFANKAFGAVTTANDMFKGCSNLVDLICPATESWKPDIDFSDCPNLTLQSLNDLIVDFLYQYDSGVHTITPNGTMWNALTAEQQTDIMAKATAKGWQIGVPAQYALKGTSTASAVYATINGAPVEIEVVAGAFRYEYNLPITSISFENDSNVTAIDFTESDLLAGITSLNDAFKGCTALQTVDFTGCDLSNVATATDCFSGCVALTSIVADSGVWMPDIDLSDTAMVYADMLSTIGMLYTYVSGVHTITFNQTTWDSFTQAQQQTISDAASAKGWTTNAVEVVYVIRGTSSNVNGVETFKMQFIENDTQVVNGKTINCSVDASGNWEYSYRGEKIYSMAAWGGNAATFDGNTTILTIEFTEDLNECVSLDYAFFNATAITTIDLGVAELRKCTTAVRVFRGCTSLINLSLSNATFEKLTYFDEGFYFDAALQSISLPNATFDMLTSLYFTFTNCTNLQSITFKNGLTFDKVTNMQLTFAGCTNLLSVNLDLATFENVTNAQQAFANCKNIVEIDLKSAVFGKVTNCNSMFAYCNKLEKVILTNATFALAVDVIRMFREDYLLAEIQMPSATFAAITSNGEQFYLTNALTTLTLPQSASYPLSINIRQSPLSYASMLAIAYWGKDVSGGTALTCTFKTSAWNALSAAEQATIQGILQSKNWNLATA